MAEAAIDKSLDQIIKERHISSRRPGRGGAGGGRGGLRRRGGGAGGPAGARGGPKLNPMRRRGPGGIQKRRSGGGLGGGSPAKAAALRGDGQWNHDLYRGGNSGGAASAVVTSGPAKLVISNLDFGVNDSDIKGLFQEFGTIRKAAVHYDRSGRSLGTADVLFDKRGDAVKALRKYNGVSLDGRPMNIQLTASLVPSQSVPKATGGGGGGGGPRRVGGGSARRGGRGGMRRGGGGAGGQPREKKPPKSAADLDAELDAYSAKMQTD